MGNMLPSVVQSRTSTLPSMNSKHTSHSIKLLTRTLHSMKRRRRCSKAKATKETSAADDKSNLSSMGAQRRAHGEKQGVVRVKVVLTRREAARLLFLSTHGEKTAAQVVREIRGVETGRANAAKAWRPALESIHEEW